MCDVCSFEGVGRISKDASTTDLHKNNAEQIY